MGRFSLTQMQVLSCQWNSLDTLQEAFIVLYKVFPPNNNREDWTSLERRREGVLFTERQMAEHGEKVPCKTTN